MAQHHEIPFTPETMVRGYLDASLPPVLTVASGDTVTLSSLPAGGVTSLPDDAGRVPAIWRMGSPPIRARAATSCAARSM